ncbi:MAG: hypothetical protein AB2L11_10805 [Syntrophobacteraceae bacterium]
MENHVADKRGEKTGRHGSFVLVSRCREIGPSYCCERLFLDFHPMAHHTSFPQSPSGNPATQDTLGWIPD